MERKRYWWQKETIKRGLTLLSLKTNVVNVIHVSQNSNVHEMTSS